MFGLVEGSDCGQLFKRKGLRNRPFPCLPLCFNETESVLQSFHRIISERRSSEGRCWMASLEPGRCQDVHIPRLQLVWLRPAVPPVYCGNLHLWRGYLLSGTVIGQSLGLGLHDLHGSGFLCSAVGLEREASCREEQKEGLSTRTTFAGALPDSLGVCTAHFLLSPSKSTMMPIS